MTARRPWWKQIWPWRRAVQAGVLCSLVAVPVVTRYHHYLSARALDKVLERWDGTLPGEVLSVTDAALQVGLAPGEHGVMTRRPRKAILARSGAIQGSPWSARVGGVSLTDPLAGGESILASWTVGSVLLVGLLIPVLATLLLGRVYCGWLCPMSPVFDLGQHLRRGLRWLELELPAVPLWRGNKYVLLGVGAVVTAAVGIPLLHYLYPPALIARESHGWVSALFDRAESGVFGLALAGLSGGLLFLAGLLALEVFVAPRFWCRAVCPGGALYSLLGRWRWLRVRRTAAACTNCTLCDVECPRGLAPMADQADAECDNCGVCVDVCPTRALGYRVGRTSAPLGPPRERRPARTARAGAAVGATVLLALSAGVAGAHHIMGIPHYSYDENYPQAPVLKLVELVGDWEFQCTGYPGQPEPGTRTELHVYVKNVRTRGLYTEPITLQVFRRDAFGGRTAVAEPETARRSENLFKFYPAYPADGNYELRLEFLDPSAATGVSQLEFPLVVGHPGNPWAVLGGWLGGCVALIVVVRAIRIKQRRRGRRPVGAPA